MRHSFSIKHLFKYTCLVLFCAVFINGAQPANAQVLFDLNETEISHYSSIDGEAEEECEADPGSNDTEIDRFLKALALQESSGNPNAISGQAPYVEGDPIPGLVAKGKYQYIDSTWVSSAARYYAPASQWPNALAPPADVREPIQDAVAYFEYTQKFRDLDGDLFKLAVSHFLPAALTDESLMDVVPSGNVLTPREYGEAFVAKVEANAGAEIELHYKEAPEFEAIAAGLGADGDTAPINAPATDCVNAGTEGGPIVQTALKFAWPNRDHKAPDVDPNDIQEARPAYREAKTEFNPGGQVSDCGVFVSTVMRASGADPDYPLVGTANQLQYVTTSDKYETFDMTGATSPEEGANGSGKMQPGDIMITSINNGEVGHTYIYLGTSIQAYPDDGEEVLDDTIPAEYQGTKYNAVDASLRSRVPGGQNVYFVYEPNGGSFTLARLKK